MSDSSMCSPAQTSPPQAQRHTCEPLRTSCQQMAQSQSFSEQQQQQQQQDSFPQRRHSSDGPLGSGSAPGQGLQVDSERFHLYRPQFGDGAVSAGCLQQCPPSFCRLQDGFSPDAGSPGSRAEAPPAPWDQYNGSYPELGAVPGDTPCFLSESYPSYNSSLHQLQSRQFSNTESCSGSKYPVHPLAPSRPQQDISSQPLFPKPIYSYSILIFMALKSSKTGSLPVSEIYSFMTEHFPYFKTAPDGWKNSVRHNLSLNKCFEKVENKNGSSSRKGCLWALNPAKVSKMQEELHKWRRKDPITVRRSMARPEDLDRLMGERPDRVRALPPYTSSSLFSRVPPLYTSSGSAQPPRHPVRHLQYNHVRPQPPCYFRPAHPSNSFSLRSPCGHQPVNSPVAERMAPVYTSSLQAEYDVGNGGMHDSALERDAGYDVDAFSPSLTDLQLQGLTGSLWEELREEVSDPQVSSPSISLEPLVLPPGCLQVATPPGAAPCKAEDDYGGAGGWSLEQHGRLNGVNPSAYSGMENLAGYPTSCSMSISLM